MSDPLALLPMAIAAGGGRVNEHEAQQLVAAGFTLLQRSAPLVRALSGRRAAILLPTSPAYVTALAASDGRGAVLVDPRASSAEIALQCEDASVGAIFTRSSLMPRVPAGMTVVLLDDAPRSAHVIARGVSRHVDLGSHHGLSLEGERDVAGSDEEAVIIYRSTVHGVLLGAVLTHANMLHNARASVTASNGTADDHVLALLPFAMPFGLTVTGIAPLLAGARVTTVARFHPARAMDALGNGITHLVGVPSMFRMLLGEFESRRAVVRDGSLRVCVCGGGTPTANLQDRWADATGVELRQGYGLVEASPVCLFNDVAHANARGTLGRPLPGVDIAILPVPAAVGTSDFEAGSAMTPLPDGAIGEICVRGANVFRRYLHDRVGVRTPHGGWLRTGDMGCRNADGTVTFCAPSPAADHAQQDATMG